jgi:tetratricopeptide (TPR) repeat protein
MKRPHLVAPGTVARLLKTAQECWKRRDYQQFFDLVERASRLDPADADILLALGRAHGLRYDYAAAERHFDKAIRVASNKTKTLAYVAQKSAQFASPELAERYYRRTLEQPDAAAETWAELARLYERLDRLEEAFDLVERALQRDEHCSLARLIRARLQRRAGRYEQAETLLRQLTCASSEEIRVQAGYELGTVLDRQGRYDEAMSAFLEAKAILTPQVPPLMAQLQDLRVRFKKLQASLSAATFQRWVDSAPAFRMRRRLALLCGYARSGTTLLEQVLDAHPDVVSAEETHIFVDNAFEPLQRDEPDETFMLAALEAAQAQALQRSRDSYFNEVERLLGNPVGGRVLIDKNPALTAFIPAFIRIFPEARLLVAMRDPRDVCLSAFMQAQYPLARETAPLLTLAGAVEEYASKMELWKTFAPLIRNPWLEVRYRELVHDLESVAHRVLDFLDVPWDERVLRYHQHARQKMVRSISYADVRKPVFKSAIGRWRNYQKFFEPHMDQLAPFLKAFGYEN